MLYTDNSIAHNYHTHNEPFFYISTSTPTPTSLQTGTLTFMCGGSDENIAKASPILERMGAKIVHCGTAGQGGVAKLCNNLSLAISMVGTCEAMALGKRLGMDSDKLASVRGCQRINMSTFRAMTIALYRYCHVP